MVQWLRFSAEYKREAMAMIESSCVSASQIATELRIGSHALGRWRLELCHEPGQAFVGNGRPRNGELALVRRKWVRMTKQQDLVREAAAFIARASR